MASITVDVPDEMMTFIQGQQGQNSVETPDSYVRRLIWEEQRRQDRKRLEQLLLDGLHSGHADPATPEYIERKMAALVERHQKATPR